MIHQHGLSCFFVLSDDSAWENRTYLMIKKKISLILSLPLIAMSLLNCERYHHNSNEEELAIYLLVGEPCSEGDYPTAIRRADSLLNGSTVMSDSLRAYIMIDRDVSILEYGDREWAASYADTVIDYGRRKGIPLAVMQGLQNKGIINRRKGDYRQAITHYNEGLELAVKTGNTEMQQVFCDMLAIASAEQGLFEEAYTFGKRSLELSQETGDSLGVLNSVATLGGILAKSGEYKKAIAELLPYHEQSKTARTAYRTKYLTPLLRSYLQLDSLQRVREILAETYEALDGTPRNTQAYLVTVNAEAGLAAKEGRYRDEWRWLRTADSIGTMGTAPDVWYSQRAECLSNLGRHREAYEMQTKALASADSIRKINNEKQLSELMVKYETLSKDNAIQKLKTQRLTWALIAIICLAAIAIITMIAINSARKTRRRQERERREEYLKGLEHERQRIARELHDDIAGSLVGLQWQLHGANPETLEDDLIKIARKVRNMSHEMMPAEFEKGLFTTMLIDYVARINSSLSGNRVSLTDEGSFRWDCLPPQTSHELYRMVQESVRNAITHGKRDADINIILSGTDTFELTVANSIDEDKSIETDSGVGIKSLKVRASLIGASVCIKNENGLYTVNVTQQQ